jgi:hypothetical protein
VRIERILTYAINHSSRSRLPTGTVVEVRDRFRGSWSHGFTIAGSAINGYWIRRSSDRYVLPTMFVDGDVRTT